MILKEVVGKLDQLFKIRTAEDFDNVGLLCGYSIIAVPTGIVTSEFRRTPKKHKDPCLRCGNKEIDKDARYCKRCGEKLL